ncbi:MAG: hypothetical protein ACLGI6_12300 [Gammaproteobacteria bacterium]
MHEFFRRALIRFVGLLLASLLFGTLCVLRSDVNAPLLPAAQAALPWRAQANTDADRGGQSAVVFDGDPRSLRFRLRLSKAVAYPLAAAELLFLGPDGRPAHVDLSAYSAIAFRVRCTPANTLTFSAPTFDASVSRRNELLTYRSPSAFFSCGERENRWNWI